MSYSCTYAHVGPRLYSTTEVDRDGERREARTALLSVSAIASLCQLRSWGCGGGGGGGASAFVSAGLSRNGGGGGGGGACLSVPATEVCASYGGSGKGVVGEEAGWSGGG